jgi:DMSO/TMAO reductase YedYZ heme-binding membrane subunit
MRVAPAVITVLVVAAFAGYYWVYRSFPVNLSFTNAIIAFSATVVLTLSFFCGPLARLIPPLRRAFAYRKDFGLYGYALAALHALLAAWDVYDRADPIAYSDATSIAFAAVAFMIFTLMALTSTSSWIRSLGYENWKNLQRTGYIALAFVFIHIALLQQGVFFERETGQVALTFILLTFFLRAVSLTLRLRRSPSASRREPVRAES